MEVDMADVDPVYEDEEADEECARCVRLQGIVQISRKRRHELRILLRNAQKDLALVREVDMAEVRDQRDRALRDVAELRREYGELHTKAKGDVARLVKEYEDLSRRRLTEVDELAALRQAHAGQGRELGAVRRTYQAEVDELRENLTRAQIIASQNAGENETLRRKVVDLAREVDRLRGVTEAVDRAFEPMPPMPPAGAKWDAVRPATEGMRNPDAPVPRRQEVHKRLITVSAQLATVRREAEAWATLADFMAGGTVEGEPGAYAKGETIRELNRVAKVVNELSPAAEQLMNIEGDDPDA